MPKTKLKLAPKAAPKQPRAINGFYSNDLGFDLTVVEEALVLTPGRGVANVVLFKEEALMLAALLRALAERLPEFSGSERAEIMKRAWTA